MEEQLGVSKSGPSVPDNGAVSYLLSQVRVGESFRGLHVDGSCLTGVPVASSSGADLLDPPEPFFGSPDGVYGSSDPSVSFVYLCKSANF